MAKSTKHPCPYIAFILDQSNSTITVILLVYCIVLIEYNSLIICLQFLLHIVPTRLRQ